VKNTLKLSLIALFSIAGLCEFFTGCSNVAYIGPSKRYVINEQLRVPKTDSIAGRFNSQIIFMADQIERNIDREGFDNTFIVTSFINLNKFSETNPLGRLVAENLIHELQVRKWKIFEFRLTDNLNIDETGEYHLSRDLRKIKDKYMVGGVVTGTYSVADGHVIINARVIDINTGFVASSAQSYMPANWFTDALLFNEDYIQPMKIVEDTL